MGLMGVSIMENQNSSKESKLHTTYRAKSEILVLMDMYA